MTDRIQVAEPDPSTDGERTTPSQPGRPRIGHTARRPAIWRRYRFAWVMVLPVVVVLSVLVLYPLVRGVLISFTDLNEANQRAETCVRVLGGEQQCEPNPDQWEYIGLDNYLDLLSGAKGRLWLQLTNTVIWTAGCVVFHYLIGLGLALLLNRPLRGREVYRVLLIVPWAMPAFVSAFAWRFLFNEDFGLINWTISQLGFSPVAWFADRWTSLFTAVAANIWLGVPFMMVALLGGLQSIPGELYEAAEMDGTNGWQRFRYVTLPGLRSVSLTVVLLSTIWTFNMFPVIYLVTGGQPAGQTEILVTGAFKEAFEGIRNYSLSATYGVIILSMLIVFASAYRRLLEQRGDAA